MRAKTKQQQIPSIAQKMARKITHIAQIADARGAIPKFIGYNVNDNTLEVYVNGVLIENIPVRLDNNPIIYQAGHVPLGQASVNLTQYHGNVKIKFRRGYTHNSGLGYVAGADYETIYSKNR